MKSIMLRLSDTGELEAIGEAHCMKEEPEPLMVEPPCSLKPGGNYLIELGENGKYVHRIWEEIWPTPTKVPDKEDG